MPFLPAITATVNTLLETHKQILDCCDNPNLRDVINAKPKANAWIFYVQG